MANVSHEFNNVITVISELSGLLNDLSLLSKKGRPIPPEKIESITENISKQIARGKHLISHMNRFSHSADEIPKTVALQSIIENMQVLTERIFKNRQTGISVIPSSEEYSLKTDPFELRRVLFACMDCFQDASSSNISIAVHCSENGKELEVQMTGQIEKNSQDAFRRLEELQKQTTEFNGRLLFEQTENQIRIRLVLPSNPE